MQTLDHLQRMLAYDDWANAEVVAAIRAPGAPPPRALRLFSHIVGAGWVWLSRLKPGGETMAVWPELTLDRCEAELPKLRRAWLDTLSGLGADRLEQPIAYTNTKGEPWRSTVQDIVTHVVLHAAHHRGQIATEMRVAGRVPASTDFILCTRMGFLD
jgi:uncharacterized damage-inducible protein DinB